MPEAPIATLSSLDSERFGIVVARADGVTVEGIPELLSFCERHRVELVIARCDGSDVDTTRALLGVGMTEVEAQITYEGPLRCAEGVVPVRRGTASDRESIAELAKAGFADMPSHYHVDPCLPLDACLEAYVDWSLRGLSGEAADLFCVAELDAKIHGFMMFNQRGTVVTSLLSTVSPAARGRSLYNSLFCAGMVWGSKRDAERIVGVTPHGNIAAQRNLIKLGLAPVGSTATFHGWNGRLSA